MFSMFCCVTCKCLHPIGQLSLTHAYLNHVVSLRLVSDMIYKGVGVSLGCLS